MAKITKYQQPPVAQPPPTYTVELSDEEIKGLSELLGNGVSGYTLDNLGLRQLYVEMRAKGLPATLTPTFTTIAQLSRPRGGMPGTKQLREGAESTIKPGDPTPCVGNAGAPGSYRPASPRIEDE
jgi:hypothetical protein